MSIHLHLEGGAVAAGAAAGWADAHQLGLRSEAAVRGLNPLTPHPDPLPAGEGTL